jgi:hypothetical protein
MSATTTRLIPAALVILAAGAGLQLWHVFGRVLQLVWLSYKVSHLESITAGRSAFALFVGLSIAGAAGALLVGRSAPGPSWQRAAWVVAGSYLAGVALWSGLIMSPLVQFTRW